MHIPVPLLNALLDAVPDLLNKDLIEIVFEIIVCLAIINLLLGVQDLAGAGGLGLGCRRILALNAELGRRVNFVVWLEMHHLLYTE